MRTEPVPSHLRSPQPFQGTPFSSDAVQGAPLPFQASSDFVLLLLPQGRQLVPSSEVEGHPHLASDEGVWSPLMGLCKVMGLAVGQGWEAMHPAFSFLFFFFFFLMT